MQIHTPFKLTLHIFGSNHWQEAMTPEFTEPQNGFDGLCEAVSTRVPLNWEQGRIRQDAEHLRALPDILVASG